MLFIGLLILSYVLGSLSSAILVCRFLSLPDPRLSGSHNAGSSNVLRTSGTKAAMLTFLGDVSKGIVAIGIGQWMELPMHQLVWLSCAAVVGHIWPIFFEFKGGKGVATALGAMIVLSYPFSISLMLIWLIVYFIFHYASVASLFSAISAPILSYAFFPELFSITLVLMMLTLCKHRSNLQRLKQGKESKL